MDHFWQSCCLIVSHLFLRFQGWSYTSRATGKIPDVQGYLVVYVINSDREYFSSRKVWLKLMYSCEIQFGLADKSLPMHPLFSQWHIKKDLNTEHSVTWERALGCHSFQELLSTYCRYADCSLSSALRTPAMWRGKTLRRAATVVSKGGKKLVKVENRHTFDQELVKTWQNSGKKADVRRQVFLFWHIFNSFIQQLVKGG